jgi:tripartite-type tricarboxylate transporter receptor subunit TctC
VLGRPNFNFDPRKFGWLGSPETINRVCVAGSNAPVQHAKDLFTRELRMGGTGAGEITTILPTLLNKLLGTKFAIVDGYKGTNEAIFAIERGEVDGICITMSQLSGARAELLEKNKIRILFNTELERLQSHPEVPTIYEFIKSETHRNIFGFINSSLEFGRPFIAPPEVPVDRLATLQTAFADMVRDPEFLAETQRLKLTVTYTSPAALARVLETMYATPQALRDEAAALMPTGRD